MSQENVETSGAVEAVRRRDLDAYLELLDADVDMAASWRYPEAGPYNGHAVFGGGGSDC